MSRRAASVFAGAILVVCLLAAGCQSTSSLGSVVAQHGPASDKAAATAKGPIALTPGMEVEWHVKMAKDDPNKIQAGHSIIAPDGTIQMGPYGSCRIAGLSPTQATAAVEKHLAKYMHNPAVTISTQVKTAASTEIAFRPGPPAATPVVFAQKEGPIEIAPFQLPKAGLVGPADDKDKGMETIPAPRVVVMPGGWAPPPGGMTMGVPVAPNECKPIILPAYLIGPTDVLLIESVKGLGTQKIFGPHLVGPDGTIRLGIYGSVPVAGLTLEQTKEPIARAIHARLDDKLILFQHVLDGLSVDVLAYNSKSFYVITDGGGQGEQVVQLPITGNDTVLSAISKINGLSVVSSKHRIWVARQTCPGCGETKLEVNWIAMTQHGAGETNWQIMPNDRIYIHSDPLIRINTALTRVLAPIEHLFGVSLLASQTVNSIKSPNSVGGVR